MPVFERSVSLSCSREEAFEFLIRPENLRKISPPEAGLVFLDAPEAIELGSRVEFKIQGYGHVQQLVHEITDFVHPERFTEKLVNGPLSHWVHEHLFEPEANGVKVTDRIEFEPPGGMLRFIVTPERIMESLAEGFQRRHDQLKQVFG